VSDIEKLIKKKIEIEAFDLEDDRLRRPPRRTVDDDAPRAYAERSADRPSSRPAAVPRSTDPFFDKPYEPASSSTPAWEAAKSAAAPVVRQLSPNIRSRKKTASLLGGGPG
jgi:hypothetical protein